MSDVSMMYWSTHIPFKSTHVAFDDDMLLLCATRSWMGLGRMTRTSSPPPTLDSARPSRRTRRLTPTCSPGHSRTKPFMCTGSRRSARRAARARRIPVRLSSRSEGPPANPRPPPIRGERWRRRRDKSTESSLFLCLLSALCPAVILPIIFLTRGSVNCGVGAVGRFKLGAALF